MNRRLIIVYITGLLIGISYGLHGPLLPIFAKDVIGASYAELGVCLLYTSPSPRD